MLFASWIKRFRQSLEQQARVQRAILAGSIHDGLRERPARGRRMAHSNPMGLSVEIVEERTLLTSLTFTVNSLNDLADANPGDGIADADLGTPGLQTTLRSAIMEANLATVDTVEIILGPGTYDLTIGATGGDNDDTGDLNITNTISAISIIGAGAAMTTIDGTTTGGGITSRIFDIESGAHRIELEDMTLRGTVTGDGGAIRNRSFLDLDDVTITSSSATGKGGGLFNDTAGFATLVNTTISGNTSTDRGAGLFNDGTLTIANGLVSSNTAQADGGGLATGTNAFTNVVSSTLSGNMAQNSGRGGAIAVDGGSVVIDGSHLTANTASGGGGIIVTNSGSVFLQRSTLDGNTASGGVGGAISIASGNVTVQNSTLSGNTATTALSAGGAIRIAAGSLNLINATITQNDASMGSDGGVSVAGGTVTVGNTIIAGNTSTGSNPDVAGSFTSLGNNIVQDATGSVGFTVPQGDLFVDPLLLALMDNGGGTPTHALQIGGSPSPAIDAGNASVAPVDDQRRVPRPQGGVPDIGAYETGFQGAIVTIEGDIVDGGDGETSLREAIIDLNNFALSDPTIIVPPGLYSLTRTGAEASNGTFNDLDINVASTIIGAGSLSTVISGFGLAGDGLDPAGNDRVIESGFGGTVAIRDLTVEGGNAGGSVGGGILANGVLSLDNVTLEDNQATDGGGLAGFDMLQLNNVSIFDNTATNGGGGVAAFGSFGTSNINESNISRNTALNGGGILITGMAEIEDTLILRNTATQDGAGIAVDGVSGGSLELFNSTVNNNNATRFGGGIATSGTVSAVGTTIESNTAGNSGAGIAATAGVLNVAASNIEGNMATLNGGGIAIGVPPTVAVTGSGPVTANVSFSTIEGNTAGQAGGGVANAASMLSIGMTAVLANTASNGGGVVNSFGGTTDIVSSTFSGNTATGSGLGGAVLNDGGTVDITNATITNNTAGSGGGIASQFNQRIRVQNTIVADNALNGGVGVDVYSDTAFPSGGNNLIGVGEFGFVNGVNGDLTGTAGSPLDPKLDMLGFFGGTTQTHRLMPGSPAIDAGNDSNLDSTDAEFDVDQRGAERILDGAAPAGAVVDIGAYEFGSNAIFVTTTIDVVDGGDGVISLREAVTMANMNSGDDTIVLPGGVYSLTLTGSGENSNATGDLDIDDDVTITGYGIGVTVIDGNMSDRIFQIDTSTVTIRDMSLEHGFVEEENGGAIFAEFSTTNVERVELIDNTAIGAFGGAIATFSGSSTLNVSGSALLNNLATLGGGAISTVEDTVNVDNSRFDNNSSPQGDGGAINIFSANATITSSQFISNTALNGRGGAIFVQKNFGNTTTIDSTRFSGNSAESGGALSNLNEMVFVLNSEFADMTNEMQFIPPNSTTTGNGGSIENAGGNLTVRDTVIQGSMSGANGGAVSSTGTNAVVLIEDSTLISNNAVLGGGLFFDETANVRRTSVVSNFANEGGGINAAGTLLVTGSTISSNTSSMTAGGILVQTGNTATIEHSTVYQNLGGGILNDGTANVKNSVVALNVNPSGQADLAGLGTYNDNGNNLISDQDGQTAFQDGVNGNLVGGQTALAVSIADATNASPIQIDTSATHGLVTGDYVRIVGVTGNVSANGTFQITQVDANSFTLDLSSGAGAFAGGGQIFKLTNPLLADLNENETAPPLPVEGGSPSLGAGVNPDVMQPIQFFQLTNRPLPASPVLDAGSSVGIEAFDNRGPGFPRDVDIAGVGASGNAPDIGAIELLLTAVSGVKFDDLNGDGVQQMGTELGLGGVTIFADLNANGMFDTGDRFIETDFDGTYTLDLLPPGPQIIGEILPESLPLPGFAGSRQTGPNSPVFRELTTIDTLELRASVAADFDGDGNIDIASANAAGNAVTVHLNQGDGTLLAINVAVTSDPVDLATGDLNGDGALDLVVADSGNNNISTLINSGAGTFTLNAPISVGMAPSAVALADFNGDGFLDAVVTNYDSNNATLLNGDGSGNLSSVATIPVGAKPVSVAVIDIDGDGDFDIVSADYGDRQLTFLINDGNGTFTPQVVALSDQPFSLDTGDFDGDGRLDLAVGTYDGTGTGDSQLKVFFNRGIAGPVEVNLGLVATGPAMLKDVRAIDTDGDGLQDIAVLIGGGGTNQLRVFGNQGSTVFASPADFPIGQSVSNLAVGDLTGDGRADLIFSDFDGVSTNSLELLVNLTGSADVTLATGVVTTNVDFANQTLAYISGTKFNDLNSNGIRDTMPMLEPGLPGVTVWLDTNGNGHRDPFEPTAITQMDDPITTGFDETGFYFFNNVLPGEVRVYEEVLVGFEQTTQQFDVQFDHAPGAFAVGNGAVESRIVDLNGDGFNDVLTVSRNTGEVYILQGTGTEHLVPAGVITRAAGTSFVSAGDVDLDGDLDLAISNDITDVVELFENEGNFTFTLRATLNLTAGDQPSNLRLTDVNGDFRADVIITNFNPASGDRGVQVFLNDSSTPGPGNYAFLAPMNLDTNGNTSTLEVADFDEDGDQDIVVGVTTTNQIQVFENNGIGGFALATTVGTGSTPSRITSADFDLDGRRDLAVIAPSGLDPIQVFFATGLLRFDAPSIPVGGLGTAGTITAGDANQDGLPDILFTDNGTFNVVLNSGPGLFGSRIVFSSLPSITGISAGLLDGDAAIDVVGVQNSASATIDVLLNRPNSIPLLLASRDSIVVPDIGNVELGTLSGTKFHDVDEDGVFDMDEDGLPGLKIFLDLSEDGIHDPLSEPSTFTDNDGNWTLTNVPVNRPVAVIEEVVGTGFAQTFPNQLLIGGAHESDTADGPDQTALGDLDGDGDNDVVIATLGANEVSIGLIDSVTGVVQRASFPAANLSKVALADVDGDGDLDILAAGASLSVALNDGNGVFGAVVTFGAGTFSSLVTGDFDGDGDIDAAAADTQLTTFLNDGSGTFAPQSAIALSGRADFAVTDDFDGDMDLDLAVTVQTQDNFQILKNDGSGVFTITQTGALDDAPVGLAVADFDTGSPGVELLAVSSGMNTYQLLTNSGSGTFTPQSGVATGHTASIFVDSADLDGDGDEDFVITDFLGSNILIGLGDGAGGFSTQSQVVGTRQTGVTLGDITNNGRPDIVIAVNVSDKLVIFPNRTGTHDVTLTAGESVGGLNFGNRALPGSISGVKFRDDNANGIQDGEPGLPGFTIYIDVNNNEMLDAGEPSAVTDSLGRYTISGLAGLEEHRVSEIGQAGFAQTFPLQPDFTFAGDVPAGGAPVDIVTGDFDGINGDDIAVSLESTNQVAVLLREPSGTFGPATTYAVGAAPFSLVTADFDNGTGLDLLVANEDDGTVTLLLNDGNGAFTAQTAMSVGMDPFSLTVGDLDETNGPDLVVVNLSLNTFRVFTNNGSGVLSAGAVVGTGAPPTSAAIADFDQDGDPDIAVTTEANSRLTVYAQGPSGVFTPLPFVSTGGDPATVQAANLNGDNVPDLVVINQLTNDATIIINNSSAGTLNLAAPVNYTTGVSGESLVLLDVNRDSSLDILTSGEDSNSVALLLNNGLGVFSPPTLFDLDDTTPVELAAIDLNGDPEDIDLVITDENFGEIVLVSNAFGSHTPTLGPGENLMGVNFGNQDILPPTVDSILRQTPLVAATNADEVTFRVTFSEDTSNVDAADFVLAGTAAGDGSIGAPVPVAGSSVFDITITGLTNSDGTIDLNFAGVQNITDLGGNALTNTTPAAEEIFTLDNTAPTVASILRQSPTAEFTNADVVTFRVTFSEDTQNVDVTDFILAGTASGDGSIGTPMAVTGSSVFDITITGLTNSNGTIDLNFNASQDIVDLVGNGLANTTPATEEIFTIDNTAPTLNLFTRQTPPTSPTNADTLVFRATFNEDVSNVNAADFAVTGTTATISNVNAVDASTYDITVSGGDLAGLNGTVGLDVAGAQDITDLAGNTLPAGEPATDETYDVDNTAPTLNSFARQTPPTSPTNADTLVFRATFNEDVSNVDAADFAVTGTTATISNVNTVDASTYDITVSGGDLASLNGTVGLDLGGSQNIVDLAGNALPGGEPTTDETYDLDNTAPTLNSFTRQTPPTSLTNADTLVFRATFSEDVSNVDAADFAVTGTTATISNVNTVDASTYDITVSGGDLAGLNGTVGLDLGGSRNIVDLAGNALPGGEPTIDETYTIDNTAPRFNSFTRQAPPTSPTNADTLVFRATFSEDVSNVDAADFAVTGTTAAISNVNLVNPSTYDITVSGGDLAGLNGTVGLDLGGSQNIVDLAGNTLAAGEPAIDETYDVDNTAPTLNSFARQTPPTSPTNADTLVFRATFNEDVNNVDAADFAVTGTTATISNVNTVDASTYDITVSGGDLAGLNGTVGLDLGGSQNIADLAGNTLPAGEPTTDETYDLDNTAPTLNSFTRQSPPTSPTNADTLVFRATFNEDVSNVDAADFAVTGTTATISNVNVVDASTYDITVSGGDLAGLNGTVGLDVAGARDITDLAGNSLPAVEPTIDETFSVDNAAPTLNSFTRQTPPTSPTNADTLVFRATFDEDVSNVTAADFAVTGTTATISNVNTVDASTYDITVSGGDLAGLDGTVGLDVAGSQDITDSVGNALPAGEPTTDETYDVDNTAPTVSVNIVDMSLTDADRTSNLTFTFDEPTSDFVLADIMAANGMVSALMGSGTTYTATFTADDGVVITGSVDVLAGSYTDAAGNPGVAGSDTVSIDTNDGPVIGNLNGETLMFTEGLGPQLINQGGLATVTDADSANFDGGSLHAFFPAGKMDGDDLSIRNQGTGTGQIGFDGTNVTFEGTLIGTFSEGSVSVDFNSSATPVAVGVLLNNITYENDLDIPSELDRMVRFDLDDGAGGAFSVSSVTTTVEVTAVNDPPFFAGTLPVSVVVTEGGDPVILTPLIDAVDPELDAAGNWEGARVFIERGPTGSPNDVFGIDASGTVSVSGANVNIDGLVRATFSQADGEATLTFGPDARPSDVDAVLRLVTYQNVSQNPPPTVNLDVLLDDGNTTGAQGIGGVGQSMELTVSVTIVPVNDAPGLGAFEPVELFYLEGDGEVAISETLTVTDVDDAQIEGATVSISSNYEMGVDSLFVNPSEFESSVTANFNVANGELTLLGSDTLLAYESILRAVTFATTTPNPAETTRTVSFQVNDGDLDSNILMRDISVELRPVTVSGVVWLDSVEDGQRDDLLETAETRVENVAVSLIGSSGIVLDSTTTQMDGSYTFTDQRPGTLSVAFAAPDGRHFTPQRAVPGNFVEDSDASRQTGETLPFTLGSGESSDNVDAGLVITTVGITGPGLTAEGTGGGSTVANFTVSLNGPSTHVVTVGLLAAETGDMDSATLGGPNSDFSQFPANVQTITFQPGETSKIAGLNINRDDVPEDNESLDAILSNPSQAILAENSTATLTITDDDMLPAPIVLLDTTVAPTVDEADLLGFTELVFKVRVIGSSTEDIVVGFETVDPFGEILPGLATPDDGEIPGDYTPISGTITIPAGQEREFIRVQVIGDLEFEESESITLQLTSVSGGGAILGEDDSQEGRINASDNATPTLNVRDGRVREQNAPLEPDLNFVIERDGSTSLPIRGTYRTVLFSGDGTAETDDFVEADATSTFEIGVGEATGVITVEVIGDSNALEGNETFGVELLTAVRVLPNGMEEAIIIGRGQATGTIEDDDGEAAVSLRPASGSEGVVDSVLNVTAELSAVSAEDVTITVSTIAQTGPGIATADGPGVVDPDYTPVTNLQITIPAGFTSVPIPISIFGDTNVELDETFRVRVTSATLPDGTPVPLDELQSEVDVTIETDDRDMANLTLRGGQVAPEFDGMRTSELVFFAETDATLSRSVIVNYRTVPLPADTGNQSNLATPEDLANPMIPRGDFVAVTSGQVIIPAGQMSAPFSIIVLSDNDAEAPLESVFVELTSFALGPVIIPGEPAPQVTLGPLDVRAQGQIRDDDGATTIAIAPAASFPEGNVGVSPAQVQVTLSTPAAQDLVLTYRTRTSADSNAAIAGTLGFNGLPVIPPGTADSQRPDFEALTNASILVPRGATSAFVPVRLIGDQFLEGDEVLVVELTGVTLANGTPDPTVARLTPGSQQSVVTITNDEIVELARLSVTGTDIFEGDIGDDVEALFNLSLSGRIRNTVEIRVRTLVVDAAGFVEIDAGLGDVFFTERLVTLDSEVTSATVPIRVIEDNTPEQDKIVVLQIVEVNGAVLPPDERLATLLLKDDDDAARAAFSVDSVSTLEGDDNSAELVFTVALNVDPADLGSAPVTVQVATLDDTAAAGVDYTALNQMLTFPEGIQSQTVRVPVLGNLIDESRKDLVLQLSSPSVGVIAGTGQGIGSILNDDSANVELQVDSVTLREGDVNGLTFARFTVSAIGQSSRDVLVDYETVADTAEEGIDFLPVSGTLRLPGGSLAPQIVDVSISSDLDLEEELEVFVLRLSNPRFDPSNGTGTVKIDPDFEQGAGIIQDDDQRVFDDDGDSQLQIITDAISEAFAQFGEDRTNPLLQATVEILLRQAVEQTVGAGVAVLFDPVDFLLTDTQGRTTGYTAAAGEFTETARSYYSGDGTFELVILPDATPGMLPLQLSGVGTGEFLQVATLVTEGGASKTITNAGVLTGQTELVLDFTDVNQNSFPQPGDEVFAQLADGTVANPGTDSNALALSAAAVQALDELQRQQSQEVINQDSPGVVMAALYRRSAAINRAVMDSVWSALDDIFADPSQAPDSVTAAFWTALGRAVTGSSDGVFELLDLLELLQDGDPGVTSEDDPNADSEPDNGNGADETDGAGQAQDAAEEKDAQAARKARRKTDWIAELISAAEGDDASPWVPPRPGDRKSPKPQAMANRPRFVEIARRMSAATENPDVPGGKPSEGPSSGQSESSPPENE